MIVIEGAQGTDEWHMARLGIPTASNFGSVMAKGKSGGESVMRADYVTRLALERLTGKPQEDDAPRDNDNIKNGREREPVMAITVATSSLTVHSVGLPMLTGPGCAPS